MKKLSVDSRLLIFRIFTIACLVAIVTCIIVDIALNRQFTWSLYPILSVPFGWLAFSPLLTGKYGLPLSLLSTTLFILPYLLLLEKITPAENWFLMVGIPSATTCMASLWLFYLMFRFLRINMWLKSAIAVFLLGAVASPVINHYVNVFLNEPQTFLNRFLNIFPLIALSILLAVVGIRRRRAVPAV